MRSQAWEIIMFRNILVHIPSERPIRPVIDVAVALTRQKAHLDAVSIGFESISSVAMVAEGGSAAVAAVMGFEQEHALERANAAISVFEAEARVAGITYSARAMAAIPADAGETIGTLSRLYDLTIVSQPNSSASSFDNIIPQAILFNSGGPMLMVPYIQKGPIDPRHVGIAWDGSRLAARALRDALPFLSAAQAVTVMTVNEDRNDAGESSSSEVVRHLSRRGITARVERLTADRGNVHGALLSAAADGDIGLLAMGGFGHSRFQERILGGVTRGVFNSMTVPVLMSH